MLCFLMYGKHFLKGNRMSTRCYIGVTTRTSTSQPIHGYKAVYGHSDGYPHYTGFHLAVIGDRENWDIELIGKTLLAHDWSIISPEVDRFTASGHIETMPGWGNFYTDVFDGPAEGDLSHGEPDMRWLYLFDGPTRTLSVYRLFDGAYRLLVLIAPKETEGELQDRLLELERASADW